MTCNAFATFEVFWMVFFLFLLLSNLLSFVEAHAHSHRNMGRRCVLRKNNPMTSTPSFSIAFYFGIHRRKFVNLNKFNEMMELTLKNSNCEKVQLIFKRMKKYLLVFSEFNSTFCSILFFIVFTLILGEFKERWTWILDKTENFWIKRREKKERKRNVLEDSHTLMCRINFIYNSNLIYSISTVEKKKERKNFAQNKMNS